MLNSLELKNRKLETKLWVVFIFVSFILAYIGWSSYRAVKELYAAEERVLAINEQLRAINRFMIALVNAETGQRGYLLTDNEAYLEPYYQGLEQVNTTLRQVHAHLSKDRSLARHLKTLIP